MRNRLAGVLVVVLGACNSSSGPAGSGGGLPGGGGAGGGVGGGGASASDGGGGTQTNACPTPGASEACCGTGTRTCGGAPEFPTWGPCLDAAGQMLTCCQTAELTSCDGGAPDLASPPPPPQCVCKPNLYRWCDEPTSGSEWHKQSCTAAGQWGPCVGSPPPAGACANGPNGYDPMCCVSLGYCCQDGATGPFLGMCASLQC